MNKLNYNLTKAPKQTRKNRALLLSSTLVRQAKLGASYRVQVPIWKVFSVNEDQRASHSPVPSVALT